MDYLSKISVYDKLYLSLVCLIESCLDTRRKFVNNYSCNQNFLEDLSKIKLAGARASGHTSAIIKYIKSNPDKTYVIFVPDNQKKKRIQELVEKKDIYNFKVFSTSNNYYLHFVDISDVHGFFIDNASSVREQEIKDIETYISGIKRSKEYFIAHIQ